MAGLQHELTVQSEANDSHAQAFARAQTVYEDRLRHDETEEREVDASILLKTDEIDKARQEITVMEAEDKVSG